MAGPHGRGEDRDSRYRSLEESGEPEGDARITQWFADLPIEPARQVYLCWDSAGGVAAITDWKTFQETWGDLWYPFDHLCVFDDSGEWALLFGPDEEVRFLEMSAQRKPA